MKTFSANSAAQLLERDRGTIVRALRHVPPDAHQGKHPRWRLRKIVDALEAKNARIERYSDNGDHLADECDAAFAEFDRRFDEMKTAPTLAERRELSIELAPLIARMIELMRARDIACDLHPDHVDLRGDRMFMLLMIGFEEPCQWSRLQCWENLDATGDPEQ